MFLQNVSKNLLRKTEPPLDRSVRIWYILSRKDDVSLFPRFKTDIRHKFFLPNRIAWEQGPDYAVFLFVMTKQSKITWSKMDFKDFVNHFKGLTRKEIADDVLQSIKDFEELNTDSGSFGSEQVKKAVCTSKERRAEASRQNGKLGGRPRGSTKAKTDPVTDTQRRIEDALKTLSESCPSENTTKAISEPSAPPKPPKKPYQKQVYMLPKRQTPLPRSPDDVQDIVFKCNLDGDDAYQWWQLTMVERHGRDRWGNPIMNWPGALINYCKTMSSKRLADA